MSGVLARFIVVLATFLSLILRKSYTADLTAFLTIKALNPVDSIYDLYGKGVSTAPVYQAGLFDRYGLVSTGVDLNSFDDVISQGALIANKTITAFIIDQELAEKLVDEYPDCQLRILPSRYQPFEYGLAFDPRTEDGIANDFTAAILSQTENGNIQSIVNRYLIQEGGCLDRDSTLDLDKISFKEVYGLWVLLAVGCAIALIQAFGYRYYLKKKNATINKETRYRKHIPRLLLIKSKLFR